MAKPLLGVMCRVTHCAHQKGRKSRLSFLQLAARESSLRGNLQGKLQISPNSSLGQQTASSLGTWGNTQCCEQRHPYRDRQVPGSAARGQICPERWKLWQNLRLVQSVSETPKGQSFSKRMMMILDEFQHVVFLDHHFSVLLPFQRHQIFHSFCVALLLCSRK